MNRSIKQNNQSRLSAITLRPFSPRGGFSYVEVLLSAVIISVLTVSAIKLFANLGRSTQATTQADIAAMLAVEMIEEIKDRHYEDPVASGESLAPEFDEILPTRINYDDIDDYNNWSACPPQDRFGQPYWQYPDITRSVVVSYVAADDFTIHTANDQDEGFKEVIITITNNNNNNTIIQQRYVIADTSARLPQ